MADRRNTSAGLGIAALGIAGTGLWMWRERRRGAALYQRTLARLRLP